MRAWYIVAASVEWGGSVRVNIMLGQYGYEGIYHGEGRVARRLHGPYFMKTLATNTTGKVGVKLALGESSQQAGAFCENNHGNIESRCILGSIADSGSEFVD